MKWTVLVENTVQKQGILAEHGLCVLVETADRRILFDAGQTDVFLKNAYQLKVSLDDLDAVVLSHGHYDHGGGLEYLSVLKMDAALSVPTIYVGKGAFTEKFSREKDGSFRNIGLLKSLTETLQIEETEGLKEIFPDVFWLSQIPQRADFEGVAPVFFKGREKGYILDAVQGGQLHPDDVQGGQLLPDTMQDEQVLIIRDGGKIHVIAGCCHMGFVSCLKYVREKFPEEAFGTVLAGMHLRSASQERLNATIEAVRELNIGQLIPVHCTGMMAIAQMKLALGACCKTVSAGSEIVF